MCQGEALHDDPVDFMGLEYVLVGAEADELEEGFAVGKRPFGEISRGDAVAELG